MKVNVKEKRNPKTGNPVTVVSNIQHNPQVIDKLASKLKKSCGAGGSIDAKTITVHGSHSDKVKLILEKEGFEVVLK